MWVDEVIRDLANRQHGVLARRQLASIGVDHRHTRTRVNNGMLEKVTPRVMRLRGIPASDSQSLMIAHLHVGEDSIVSHGTAARLWGIAGFRLDPIHLAIERNHHCEFGLGPIRVHHATVVPDWCRKLVRGIPVVSPGLAIYQLAGTISPERVARALDNAWSLRLVNGRTIDDLLERLGRSGRNGTVVLRELRHVRPDDWVPPASNIESRFDSIMQRAGIRAFRRQVDIGDEEWSGRVDFLADDCPLIVEILSERYHTSLTDARADAERRTRHQSMGYTVVEVWDWEIFQQPWAVVARVQEARNRLLSDV